MAREGKMKRASLGLVLGLSLTFVGTASGADEAASSSVAIAEAGEGASQPGAAGSAEAKAGASQSSPAGASQAEAAKPIGHCSAETTAFFACTFKGGKVVSLCGDEEAGDLQYLFGKPGAVELTWPEKAEGAMKQFKGKELTYIRATGDAVSFQNGAVTYEITSLSGGGGPDGEANNFVGVTVSKAEKTLATLTCQDIAVDNLVMLRPKLPQSS